MSNGMQTIIGILLFAVATAIIYAWGLKKTGAQQKDLLQILYGKGAQKVIKKLKTQKFITKSEIEQEVLGVTASQFYSRKKAVVTDKKEFTRTLIEFMMNKNLIMEDVDSNKRVYKLR